MPQKLCDDDTNITSGPIAQRSPMLIDADESNTQPELTNVLRPIVARLPVNRQPSPMFHASVLTPATRSSSHLAFRGRREPGDAGTCPAR
jgi:hypothetical protein